MTNFVKISGHMKKISIQGFDRSVRKVARFYFSPISAVTTNKQLFVGEKTCTKFQVYISKTEGVVDVYTDRQKDSAHNADNLYMYIYVLQKCLRRFLLGVNNFVASLR